MRFECYERKGWVLPEIPQGCQVLSNGLSCVKPQEIVPAPPQGCQVLSNSQEMGKLYEKRVRKVTPGGVVYYQ
jgi:hypothetical protein